MVKSEVLQRTVDLHNLKPRIEPWEKHIVHECSKINKKVAHNFKLVTPKTIRSWNNILIRLFTGKRKYRKPGRPRITKDIRERVLSMKQKHPRWGYVKIKYELKKLSIDISHESIGKILRPHRKNRSIPPTGAWKNIQNTVNKFKLFACDFFVFTTLRMKTYYVFFVMQLETRKIVQFGVTDHPNIQFLRNQFSWFEYNYPGSTIIHDNSGELKWFPYSQYNIKDISIIPYSPNMNAHAERFVRTIRQECLDHLFIFTYNGLYGAVKEYIDYYNNYRPHQGLKGQIPNGLPEECSNTGVIKRKPMVFKLHSHYYREAA